MNIAVMARNDETSEKVAVKAKKIIVEKGGKINEVNPDVVIFIGGDGTFLRVIHSYFKQIDRICFAGINLGTLGFFADFTENEIEILIEQILNGALDKKSFMLLEANLFTVVGMETIYALNEFRIENPFHTLICDVEIDRHVLERYRGNGLVVSSAAGSSAYNKSLGGALIGSESSLLQFTEIAPIQSTAHRCLGSPLIIDGHHRISFSGDFSRIVIGYDYLIHEIKNKVERIEVSASTMRVNLLRKKDYHYIDKIKKTFIGEEK